MSRPFCPLDLAPALPGCTLGRGVGTLQPSVNARDACHPIGWPERWWVSCPSGSLEARVSH